MTEMTAPDPRALILRWLGEANTSLTMREFAEKTEDAAISTPWTEVRRAIWAMLEEGQLGFTPDWRIFLQHAGTPRSVRRHAAPKAKRSTTARAQ